MNKNGWTDGGWKSRKMWFSVFSILAIVYLTLQDLPSATLDIAVGGIVVICGLFLGSNLGGKFVSTKSPLAKVATLQRPEASGAPSEERPESSSGPQEESPR